MKTKLISAYLETDDNSFILDGYNLTHRLQPMAGTKLKIESVTKFYDPVTGRNIDRVVFKFYGFKFLINFFQKFLNKKLLI